MRTEARHDSCGLFYEACLEFPPRAKMPLPYRVVSSVDQGPLYRSRLAVQVLGVDTGPPLQVVPRVEGPAEASLD